MDVQEALSKATVIVDSKLNPTPQPRDDSPNKVETRKSNDLMNAFFKIDPYKMTEKTGEKMEAIYEYAKDKVGKDDEFAIVSFLRDIKYRMGAPRGLISNIDNIYKYVRLRQRSKQLEGQAKAMEQ